MSACANQIKICAWSHGMCDHIGSEDKCPHCKKCSRDANTVTIAEYVKLYSDAAKDHHERTGQLTQSEINNSLHRIGLLCMVCGIPDSAPIDDITRRRIAQFADHLKTSGLAPASIKTYCVSIQRMFAKWVRHYCEDLGYDVKAVELPDLDNAVVEYHTPPASLLTKVKVWYQNLLTMDNPVYHIYAMMMYHFAMRNGDVDRLTWGAFSVSNGKRILTYTPNKTSRKSHRIVRVEVCDLDWYYLERFRNGAADTECVIPGGSGGSHDHIRAVLNKGIRELGFTGSKALYELRKICGDEYAKRVNIETAKNILGHRLVTGSTKHYVDGNAKIVPTIWG